ncbi:MAG TPA: hypothetical protein PLL09_04705 [Flavobacterium sp.]|uniref:hypothetical protein n=1 Tax=unclassified Flavobacterium TaxID=196869 RepID=UPI0025C3E9D3|nr:MULTISPECIES: hypothetical protein [unclassified Flavobacterium]HRE77109.1 hypothetical protein [Flavobacterium sp.]
MVLINTFSSNLFTFNGVRLVRNFIPLKAGSASITIINAYDSKYQLMGSTHYSNISVNGEVFGNQTDLMNALSPILFVKQTAENSFSGNYNDLAGIPSEFNPSPHTHEIEDINGLDTLLNPTLDSVLINGNISNEDAYINSLYIKDLGASGYANINFNTGAFYVQDSGSFYQFICDGGVGALAVGRNSDNVYFSIKSDLLTASRELFIPNESGIIATRQWVSANTITPTLQQVLNTGDFATGSNIILSDGFNKTAVFGGDEIRLVDASTNETLYLHYNNIQFLGETGITDLVFENPTSSNVLTFPDKTGTLATLDDIGGGLESLSGDGVDNTDPLNPVMTYPTPDEIGAENALGFTPEDVNNKAVDFSIVDDTLYPSVQAVKTELDLKADKLNSSTVIISKSNSSGIGISSSATSETVLYSFLISGGTFSVGDFFKFRIGAEKDGTVSNATYRVRVGVNGDTSDNLLATCVIGANNSRYTAFERQNIYFNSSSTLRAFAPATTTTTDITSGNPASDVSCNPSNNFYISITAQLTSTDFSCKMTTLELARTKTF